MSAAEFKERCLKLLDDVGPDGIVITKRGKPVAKLVPAEPGFDEPEFHPMDLYGVRPDIIIDPDDELLSTGIAWEAELPDDPEARAKFIAERAAMGRQRKSDRQR